MLPSTARTLLLLPERVVLAAAGVTIVVVALAFLVGSISSWQWRVVFLGAACGGWKRGRLEGSKPQNFSGAVSQAEAMAAYQSQESRAAKGKGRGRSCGVGCVDCVEM